MKEQLIPIGLLVIFIGFILVLLGTILMALKEKTKTEWAVGGIFWFIPFGFGSRGDLVKLAIVISMIFLFILLILNYFRGW